MSTPDITNGTWDVVVRTPIGRQPVSIDFTRDPVTNELSGVARAVKETVPVRDVVQDGTRVRWVQSVTTPMRLDIAFAVTIEGDEMSGTAKAGKLPNSPVVGRRETHSPETHSPETQSPETSADVASH